MDTDPLKAERAVVGGFNRYRKGPGKPGGLIPLAGLGSLWPGGIITPKKGGFLFPRIFPGNSLTGKGGKVLTREFPGIGIYGGFNFPLFGEIGFGKGRKGIPFGRKFSGGPGGPKGAFLALGPGQIGISKEGEKGSG